MSEPITTRIQRFEDERGWFMSSFSEQHPQVDWKTQNTSYSRKGTLRGLHYQAIHPQAKLVTVLEGEITDIIIDIDSESETFGEWQRFRLSSDDEELPNQIYVPNHYAHGFAVTSETALISYLTDELYYPSDECSIHPLSSSLALPWGLENPILSLRDSEAEEWSLTAFRDQV